MTLKYIYLKLSFSSHLLTVRTQKPLQVDFDLLLWLFQRYHAEPGIATEKCKFKLFDEKNESPNENIKLIGGERE